MTTSDHNQSTPDGRQGQPAMPPAVPPTPPGYPQQQPMYGYQPGYPPGYPYPQPRQTNTMAIVSLVMVFVFAPLAIVFGAIAKKQIRERDEDGAGLATGGLIGGIVVTVLQVLVVIGLIIYFVWIFNELDAATDRLGNV